MNKHKSVSLQCLWDSSMSPCLDLYLCGRKDTAILQGYELDASNMGGWTLDKHHTLDVQNVSQPLTSLMSNTKNNALLHYIVLICTAP